MENFRSRAFIMLLYPDDPSHEKAIDTLTQGGFKFAYILHDKDVWSNAELEKKTGKESTESSEETEDDTLGVEGTEEFPRIPGGKKKPHYHVVLKFDNACWRASVAKQLGIKPNYIKKCVNVDKSLLYLIHMDHPEKYQYDHDEVRGPLLPSLKRLLISPDEGTRILCILDEIDSYSMGMDSDQYKLFVRKICSNGLWPELRRAGSFVQEYIRAHNESCRREWERDQKDRKTRESFGDFVSSGKSKTMDWVEKAERLGRHYPPAPMEDK